MLLRRILYPVLAVILVAGLAACGDDDDDAGAPADGDNVLEVGLDEYNFAFSGSPVAGDAILRFDNTGDEWHMLAAGRLKSGVTITDVRDGMMAAFGGEGEGEGGEGEGGEGEGGEGEGEGGEGEGEDPMAQFFEEDEIADSLHMIITPGGKVDVTVSGLVPGEYAAICFLPTPDGSSHFEEGMLGQFTVADGAATVAPTADATYVADAAGTQGPTELAAGSTTFRIERRGEDVPDEVFFVKIREGHTPADIDSYFAQLDEGGEFGDFADAPLEYGALGSQPGAERYFTVDLTPGRWAVALSRGEVDEPLPAEEDPHIVFVTVT